MMKKYTKILLGILFLVVFPNIVNADYVPTMQCDGRIYTVTFVGETTVGGYTVSFYDTTAEGLSGIKTYCMSPGKIGRNYLSRGGSYTCERMIDPSGGTSNGSLSIQAFDVAVTKAYQTLLERGLTAVTTDNRVIGELLFRWLSFNYGVGDRGTSYSTNASYNISLFVPSYGGQPSSYWNNSDNRVATAKEIYNIAMAAGNKILEGTTYEELVKNGTIWGPNYKLTLSGQRTEGNLEYYTYEVDFSGTDAPSEIYWSLFSGGCENSTVRCVPFASGDGQKGKVEIQVQKMSNYDGGDYKIYVDSAYYDARSASSNILLTRPVTNSSLQRMLIAIDGGGSPNSPSRPPTKTRTYPERNEGCEKQANGTFDYVKYKDGKEESRTKVTNEADMIKYSCPVYCTMRSDSVRTDDQYGWADAEHYGKLTYGNGYFFNKSDYEQYCNNPPTTTTNVCKHVGDSYTCKNGSSCDQKQFFIECCDQIDKDSDDYKKYCSCGEPEIDFIGACTEFNSSNEYLNNHVSDTTDDAQLKYCLFNDHNQDIANNSYEMTDQSSVTNNPYCRVSCIEEFDFKVPNAQYTMSGTYFTLGTEVTGTRKCYVNQKEGYDGIDYKKFTEDLKAAADRLANAYNEYNKLNTGLSNTTSRTINGTSHYEISYSCNCDASGCHDTCHSCGDIPNDCSTQYWYNTSYTYTTYTASVSGSGRDISINLIQGSATKAENSWHHGAVSDGACNTGTCSVTEAGSLSGLQSRIRAGDGSGSMEYWAGQISTITQEINNIFAQYNDCSTGWENNFEFDPTVKFDYDEPYNSMINDTFEKVETLNSSSSNIFCASDVNDRYECSNATTTAGSYAQRYFTCTTSGCQAATKNISNAIYITKTKTESARYEPRNYFSIYTPSGTISLDKDSGTYLLYTGLCDGSGACLPIALNTNTGVFNFKFKFSNVGQYNDNNENGRLIGQQNSVFNVSENEVEAGYVCQYVNNCPECDYVCMGDECNIRGEDQCTDGCTYVCMNCLFDGNNNTFFYRTVSLNSLFPNTRAHGYNWDDSTDYDTNEKAAYTINKIQEAGETAYGDPEYSYSLSPQQMSRIREYNKQVGGYLNTRMADRSTDSLHCESRSIAGKNYQNIVCYSTFLDTTGNTYFTELKRNDVWTLWPESGYFTSQNKYSMVFGIGPAWK